jgi:outer membrane porin, OprD family
MGTPVSFGKSAASAATALVMVTAATSARESAPENVIDPATLSGEEGQTSLEEAFEWNPWRVKKRGEALRNTHLYFNFRTYYLDRDNFDGTKNEAWAAGGWAGAKTGYFLDHVAIGLTGYTSQHLQGGDDTDGTLLLAPGQESYSVLGELYTDIRIVDGLNLLAGRKEFDTPFINRNDTRMTPNTFEAVTLQGQTGTGGEGGAFTYGAGYFDSIKERNSEEFVSMSVDAGATVERGVFTAGGLYQKGGFSIGAIDYYSADIINIGYFQTKLEVPVLDDWKLRFAAQYIDQRSVGDDLLTGSGFTARQFGLKAELAAGQALFTTAFTSASGDADLQNPWSGYPGYTSSQVEDFNRDGESAFLFRAGYEFAGIEGLGAYAQGVFGTTPDQPGQYRQDECDLNLQWAPTAGVMKGFALRLRYAVVEQHGGGADTLTDFRVICNYAMNF